MTGEYMKSAYNDRSSGNEFPGVVSWRPPAVYVEASEQLDRKGGASLRTAKPPRARSALRGLGSSVFPLESSPLQRHPSLQKDFFQQPLFNSR